MREIRCRVWSYAIAFVCCEGANGRGGRWAVAAVWTCVCEGLVSGRVERDGGRELSGEGAGRGGWRVARPRRPAMSGVRSWRLFYGYLCELPAARAKSAREAVGRRGARG